MGNYRFRLSDMIPNAWFYKLKDMSKTKTHQRKPQSSSSNSYIYSPSTITKQPQNNQHFSQPRNSIYYTPKVSQFQYNSSSPNKFPHFHDSQKKSSKNKVPKPNRKTIYKPSPKHTHSTQPLQEFFHSPNVSPRSSESTQSELATASWCTTCRLSSSTSDIIDINDTKKTEFFLSSSSPEKDLKLPPIITKQSKLPISRNKQISHSSKQKLVNQTPARKSISNGVKLRANSPKLAVSKRLNIAAQRKNLTESFAIVKSSFDPQKDFMESMMEMIIENNIKSSKDLEELLACYLSLNSTEYHDVIVKAFEQIWFNLPNL